jgi:selenobiotic family peptide radical SAM maturase
MTLSWPCQPEDIFPTCKIYIDPDSWANFFANSAYRPSPEQFPKFLESHWQQFDLSECIPDLARVEFSLFQVSQSGQKKIPDKVEVLCVNPTLQLLQLSWSHLLSLLNSDKANPEDSVKPEPESVLVWRDPDGDRVKKKVAVEADLLALKIVTDELSVEEVAAEGGVAVGVIDRAIDRAVRLGLLLRPPSRIERDSDFPKGENIDNRFFSSPVFTLQWHITQVCDLHCRHCYDRSSRATLPLDKGITILDDFRAFCLERNVRGQISFTGGNPLLHPNFLELYQAAVDRNLMTAILGNPCSRRKLEEICAIQEPVFYQVSLEGLAEHNDYIRGEGHFDRIISFLELLKEMKIYSMVMLTMTRANMDQVLPLADCLRDKVDLFTYNRLAMVGEGAQLLSVRQDEYRQFLKEYLQAATENPVISLKDNLLNLARSEQGQALFGGCAGHGCGAAFNFIAALPDGEVHACRKLPSLIGNIFEQSIAEIYDGEKARKYRQGASSCSSCAIRPVCGGCPAVVYGFGLDVFVDRDPYCFLET